MSGERILIIDDSADMRQTLEIVLDLEGWLTKCCATGEDGLAAVAVFDPALILLDQSLPGITGVEVATQVRARGFDTPMVLFSGLITSDLQEDAMRLDLTLVVKSGIDDLVSAIDRLLKDAANGPVKDPVKERIGHGKGQRQTEERDQETQEGKEVTKQG